MKTLPEINQSLRKEVENVFGKTIRGKSDCEELSLLISKELKQNLSYQTIRRYWGLVHSENNISVQSKNILCKFIGHKDFATYSQSITQTPHADFNWSIMDLWQQNQHNESIDNYAYWHYKLSQSFSSFILTNEIIFEDFARRMCRNEIAMKYVISYHPMYDNLGKEWYFRGFRLFLRYAKELHYRLFEADMEFMRCIYTNEQEESKIYAHHIKELLPEIRKKYGTIWPLEARSLSALLYFYQIENQPEKCDLIQNEILGIIEKNKNFLFEKDNYTMYVFTISDYLNIYGFPEISLELQKKYLLTFPDNALWRYGYNEAGKIVKSLTFLLSGFKEESKLIFDEIDPKYLNFDFKIYFTIQYHLLELAFYSKQAEYKRKVLKQNITSLINSSRLLFFNQLLDKIWMH